MASRHRKGTLIFIIVSLVFLLALPVMAAYKAHDADKDTKAFLEAYPQAKDTKLDNCYLCHTGGNVGKNYKDSCDYCHDVYGLKPPWGNIDKTLNQFGLDYWEAGKTKDAFVKIAKWDSDGDGVSNEAEILAGRLPGDANDHPGIVDPPAVKYTREEIRQLPKVTQFMAVDTAKAGDFYTTYEGVAIWDLLKDAGIRDDAVDITVFAADGYSKNFTISEIKQIYPQGNFFTKYPWISFPLDAKYRDGATIAGKLRYILAYNRNGFPLEESKIVADETGRSRLNGEGPYRFITPLEEPVVPDRSQYSVDRDDSPYPYNPNRPARRNGDFCIKSIVAIRVNTEDNKSAHYDWSGGAWRMIENGELVVYGAIEPKGK